MGVDLFFILSGYLITGGVLRAKEQPLGAYLSGFYARRMKRLLIPYLLFLGACTVVYGAYWMAHWWLYFGAMNFLRPMGIRFPAPFTVLWSLAVEEQFYFVWPVAVFFLSPKRLKWLAVFLILLAPTLRGTCHFSTMWPIYMLTPFRMDLLAVGALLCLLRRRWSAWWALLIPVGLAIPCILLWPGPSDLRVTHPVLYYEATLLICLGLALWGLSGARWMTWTPFRYLGKVSYSFYLFHGLALSLLHRPILAFLATLGYSALSWWLIEEPMLKAAPAPSASCLGATPPAYPQSD